MSENFDVIEAPQFFDFTKNSQDDVDDSFFDKYYEVDINATKPCEDPLKFDEFREVFVIDDDKPSSYNHEDQRMSRRSMSMGDLVYIETALKNSSLCSDLTTENTNKANSRVVRDNNKIHNKHDVQRPYSTSHESLKRSGAIPQRSISKESLNRLAQPKKKFGSDQTLNRNCLTMAEAVKKFQNSTPERFRSKPKIDLYHRAKLGTTIPHSPNLVSNKRTRPVHAVSHEERERIDFEEAQKFKIKAHPVNKKILSGPLKPTVPMIKKPNTIVEPFKLTEVPPKAVELPKNEVPEFHAKSVPDFNKPPLTKTVFQKHITKPQTPNVLKRCQKTITQKHSLEASNESEKQPSKLTRTHILPFSFEVRNQALRKKKEQFIQQVFEEEKKAREFHARPVPKAVLVAPKNKNTGCSRVPVRQLNLSKSKTKSEENLSTEFKARPPTVLYKKPFEPKKDEKPLTEINEFQLNTDLRAREREYFEQHLKEKEERLALAKQLEEQMRLQKEEEEAIKLRKMTEYKAQPIKKYKEVVIQPSGKVTNPISPKFHNKKKKDPQGLDTSEENKENST